MRRRASAVWRGPGMEGSGALTVPSGALTDLPYTAKARFQDESGTSATNPEELIAAAHAGCFSMALSFQLSGAGSPPEEIRTEARLTLEKQDIGWTITKIHLDVTARVPGMDAAKFQELAETAKAGCPVSRALKAEITMDARLA